MSDTVICLNNRTKPICIPYAKSTHGFSDNFNDSNRYLFELVINGVIIGKKYFSNLEETKYSHLIKISHQIKLTDIQSYKASVSIYPSEDNISYELEGKINQEQSCSTQRNENIYVEFTKNDSGYALCSCFYTGLDHNKILATPPN